MLSTFLIACVLVAAPPPAVTFHFMQIEQVIGGVNGDTTAQAIQLRMRTSFQNFVSGSKLVVYDATGSNPIELLDIATNVANGSIGSRVLLASANFVSQTTPPAVPDFTLTNLIPASYLAAGSLTFEDDLFGTVNWRLSWGGAAYTGSTMGSFANDADGDFGPPFAGPLPSTDATALLFPGTASAPSTNNAADYTVTAGPATFTNNAGLSFSVNSGTPIPAVSEWSLLAMLGLLLAAGMVVLMRRAS